LGAVLVGGGRSRRADRISSRRAGKKDPAGARRRERRQSGDRRRFAFRQGAARHSAFGAITGLIFGGVFDRHPRVKLVMAEAGLAWIPSMIQGLDIWYQRSRDGRRLTGDRPVALPELLPSEYFQQNIWISFVDDPLGVKMVGGVLDEDRVMFGSDYPHPASTWPYSQRVIEEHSRHLSAQLRRKIFRDNARALFGI